MRIHDCVSTEERKASVGAILLSIVVWLGLGFFLLGTMGFILIFYALAWLVNWVAAEYNVRKLQAMGTAVTAGQFPEVTQALAAVCQLYGVKQPPRVIIINVSQLNAMAIRFARKRVIVLFSQTVEGMLEKPAELRFILGHEMAHLLLDQTFGGKLLIMRPAAFRAGRELTCDNAGTAAAGEEQAAKDALKRLAVGNYLYPRLDDAELAAESAYIYSGLTGWILKQYLTYPPVGKRVANVMAFAKTLPRA
jgi:Zn-dependent protease with chaperone function